MCISSSLSKTLYYIWSGLLFPFFLQIAYLTYMPSICFYLERFFLWPTNFQKLWAVVVDEAYRLDYILDIHIFFKIFPNLLACMWFCYAVIWKFALHLNETGFNSWHSFVSSDAICMVHVIWSSLKRFVCSGWVHGSLLTTGIDPWVPMTSAIIVQMEESHGTI